MNKDKKETVMMEVPKELEEDVMKLKKEYENTDIIATAVALFFVGIAVISIVVYIITGKQKLKMPMILCSVFAVLFMHASIKNNGGLKNTVHLLIFGHDERKENS